VPPLLARKMVAPLIEALAGRTQRRRVSQPRAPARLAG
jgi:hypothetical protein